MTFEFADKSWTVAPWGPGVRKLAEALVVKRIWESQEEAARRATSPDAAASCLAAAAKAVRTGAARFGGSAWSEMSSVESAVLLLTAAVAVNHRDWTEDNARDALLHHAAEILPTLRSALPEFFAPSDPQSPPPTAPTVAASGQATT